MIPSHQPNRSRYATEAVASASAVRPMIQAAAGVLSAGGKGRSCQNFSFLAFSSSSEMRLEEAERIILGLPAPRLAGL